MNMDTSRTPLRDESESSLVAELRASLERANFFLNGALGAVINMDARGHVTGWNPKAERMFGYSRVHAMGQDLADLIMPPVHREAHRRGVVRYLQTKQSSIIGQRAEVPAMRADGSEFPIEMTVSALEQNGTHYFCAHIYDITDRKRAEEGLRIAGAAFESHEAMAITDAQGVILRVNQAFTAITDYEPAEALGQKMSLLNSGRQDAAFYESMWECIRDTGGWQGEIWNRRKGGMIFPAWLTVTAVKGGKGRPTHFVGTFTDITLRKAAEVEIQQLAFYDTLTGLPNRRLLTDRLKQALVGSVRRKRSGALLFIDLDNFKALNETLGHDKGDLLLKQVGERLSDCVREGDTVARIGGDEFVIILQDLSGCLSDAAGQAQLVGEKILIAAREPFLLGPLSHHGSASLGVALFNESQDSVEELLKRADLALYKAKDAGRNTLQFFDADMQSSASTRAALEADFRLALQENQFLVYYQPQVDTQGRMMGVEALVRWLHPRRGLVSPAHFIPLAEETGLILPLGDWVLRTACLQLRVWAEHTSTAHLTVAVNVSARQFHRTNFVEDVLRVLDQTGAPPSKLKLELTESLLVKDVDDIVAKMTKLKSHGVGFSLDDFGTGYSSLTYLKRLPLDQLKIDQSFLLEALTSVHDAAIASAIVSLGKSLGLTVIAEGVETKAQRDFLEGEGCVNYQGYYFGHPVPVESLSKFFLSGSAGKTDD